MVFEKTIVLSSAPARKVNANNKPEDFTTKISPIIKLDQSKKYKICLVSFTGTYSWHNIQTQSNNNLIKYSIDGGVSWKNILFPDGVYSYSDINSFIHYTMKENGDFVVVDGVDSFDINLYFSLSTFLVTIELTNGYQLDLNTQEFSNLLGFNVGILTSLVNVGQRLPNITNSIDTCYVRSSAVTNSVVDGASTDIIFSFSTANLRRSYSFVFEPFNLLFSELSSNMISSIRMAIYDVNDKPIDLNGVDISYTLLIREDI